MKTAIFKKLPTFFSLACLVFTACKTANATGEDTVPEYSQSSPTIEQMETEPPAIDLPSNVWDTSDIDTSLISSQKKLIAFTFDDAPSRTLENILAVYAAYNESNPDCPAFATVFCNGKYIDAQSPPLLAAAYGMGFELGNHTHSHYDLSTLSKEQLQWEIDTTDEILCTIDGKKRHLLRAPFGRTNDLVKAVAPTPLIDWTIDTLDWTGISEDEIYRSVMDNKFSGAIVLMHDGYAHTVDALKRLLPDLKAEGYQVVNVSQLAKMHACTLTNGKVYIRARKQK